MRTSFVCTKHTIPDQNSRMQRRCYLWLWLSLTIRHATAFCDELPKPSTWQNLVEWMDSVKDTGFGVICPFEISGDGCPSQEEQFSIDVPSFYVICATFLGNPGDKCILDCPNTHFEVQEFSQFAIEGWTIRGTKTAAAVSVRSFGEFVSYSSSFEENANPRNNGGAIYGEDDSTITLEFSDFIENRAENGGAIHSEGNLNIVAGEFSGNSASGHGGAISLQGSGRANIDIVLMENNSALHGPAIFKDVSFAITTRQNEGCNNLGLSSNEFCNGVQDTKSCRRFETVCAFAGVLPTRSPTDSPTSRPSTSPVSLVPTSNPTALRTVSRTTSSPSPSPATSIPTAKPTALRTAIPTTRPSFGPTSLVPTTKSTLFPTEQPTIIHSEPSSAPKELSNPTDIPALSSFSAEPSSDSSDVPTWGLTDKPSGRMIQGSTKPSSLSQVPSDFPTEAFSDQPSDLPSDIPSYMQSDEDLNSPSRSPAVSDFDATTTFPTRRAEFSSTYSPSNGSHITSNAPSNKMTTLTSMEPTRRLSTATERPVTTIPKSSTPNDSPTSMPESSATNLPTSAPLGNVDSTPPTKNPSLFWTGDFLVMSSSSSDPPMEQSQIIANDRHYDPPSEKNAHR